MERCIRVESNITGTRFGETGNQVIHGLHHQMHINGCINAVFA